jgi:hypothetical protein
LNKAFLRAIHRRGKILSKLKKKETVMKRFKAAIVTTVVAGLMFLGGNAWAGSSASAGAGAQSNATNSNQNSAGAIGTGGNGYGGAAQSSVSIDSHSTSNYQNRQFLNAGAVSAPTMQDFSSRTDHPWNTMEPLFGRFSKSQSAGQTIKYLHKEIIPVQTWSPAKNVTFVDNRLKVPEGAQYGGDIYVMVTKDETTTQAQILTYEPARTSGWNYCRIMSSYYRPESKQKAMVLH